MSPRDLKVERTHFETRVICRWDKGTGTVSGKIKDQDDQTDEAYGIYLFCSVINRKTLTPRKCTELQEFQVGKTPYTDLKEEKNSDLF